MKSCKGATRGYQDSGVDGFVPLVIVDDEDEDEPMVLVPDCEEDKQE